LKILFLGGARSGKSRLALAAAEGLAPAGKRIFVAPAEPLDEEMARRVAAHQAHRGPGWQTKEEPLHLAPLAAAAAPDEVLLFDCLTLWLSNLLAAHNEAEEPVEAEAAGLVQAVEETAGHVVVVANEVGLGIVPQNALARLFRDMAGRLNQEMGRVVDQVFFVAAGLPLRLK